MKKRNVEYDSGVLFYLDEVQRLLPKLLSNSDNQKRIVHFLGEIHHRGRKRKYGVIYATQSPLDIKKEIIDLCNTKIFFQIQGDANNMLKEYLSKEERERLKQLPTGQAFITSKGEHDLFSGAGGLSLGFKTAGFSVKLAVEREKSFCESYRYNNPECDCLNEDITKLSFEKNLNEINNKYLKDKVVEGVIGGPPCQGFSSVGNRKLKDPRNSLIYFFIKWVERFKPTFYVMENVSGILTMANGQVAKKIKEMYRDIGYSCHAKTLVAADYGVPQLRKRVFFVGTKGGEFKSLKIPRTNSDSTGQRTLFNKKYLPKYLTVDDALSDILEIEPFRSNTGRTLFKEYTEPPKTDYQEYLRKDSDQLYDHIAPNHSQLVVDRISHVEQGKNHKSLPQEYQLKGGYSNIYGRLHLKKPADTITGNCGCVSAPGRFIHPTQHRALSVREAARLQSFPDEYRFFGSARDKYQQVGNSVPALMAYAVARAVKEIV